MPALPDLTARLRLDTTDLEAGVKRASGLGSAVGSAFGNLAASGISGAVGGLKAFATGSVDAFARVEDALGAAGVQFGSGLGTIEKFADGAAAGFGISKGAALDAVNTFGTLGKAAGLQGEPLAGFSTKFAGLAGDLASFKGTSTEQAIEAVGAALRGESEPIRAYGVLLDDASLRQEALAQGLIKTTKQALTPQQKVLATQALILKQTKDATGDYQRTADSTANTQKTLAAETENAQAALGAKLAPAVTALRGGFLELVRGAGGVVEFIGGLAAQVQPVVAAFAGGLKPALDAIVPAIQAFVAAIPSGVLAGLAVVLGVITAALVAQAVASAALAVAHGIGSAAAGLFATVTNVETGAVQRGLIARIAHNVAVTASAVVHGVAAAASGVLAVATGALNAVMNANPFVRVATLLFLLIAAIVTAYQTSDTFRAVVAAAFDKVKDAGAALASFFTSTIPAAFEQVKAKVTGIVEGLRAGLASAWAAIKGAVTTAFDAVKAYFTVVWETIKAVFTVALEAVKAVVTTYFTAYRTVVTTIFEAIKTAISVAWGAIKAVFTTALEGLKIVVSAGFDNLKANVTAVFEGIKSLISAAWGLIKGVFSTALDGIKGVVSGALAVVVGLFTGNFDKMKDGASTALNGVVTLVRGVPAKIVSALGNLGGLLVGAGADLMEGLARGVANAGRKVVEAAQAIMQKVKDLLPGSPIKSGPLKSWNRGGAGLRLMGLLEDGVRAGGPGVQDALSGVLDLPGVGVAGLGAQRTAAGRAAAGGGSPVSLTSQVVVEGNVSSDVDLYRILDERDRALVGALRAGVR